MAKIITGNFIPLTHDFGLRWSLMF